MHKRPTTVNKRPTEPYDTVVAACSATMRVFLYRQNDFGHHINCWVD